MTSDANFGISTLKSLIKINNDYIPSPKTVLINCSRDLFVKNPLLF